MKILFFESDDCSYNSDKLQKIKIIGNTDSDSVEVHFEFDDEQYHVVKFKWKKEDELLEIKPTEMWRVADCFRDKVHNSFFSNENIVHIDELCASAYNCISTVNKHCKKIKEGE